LVSCPITALPQLTLSSDDSHLNTKAAHALGWTAVHLLDKKDPEPAERACQYQIRSLEELRGIFPQFFKKAEPE
jgi:pyrimidine and pyridine-specific 5'-nucleotidase